MIYQNKFGYTLDSIKRFLKEKHNFDFFEKFSFSWNIFLWCSGWPDSMFLLFLLHAYAFKNGYDLSKIFVLHYNHWYRKEISSKEMEILANYVSWLGFTFIWASSIWSDKTERWLRKERYDFFSSCTSFHITPSYFFLWHHLIDRVETSLLHLTRWCNIDWFLNMKETTFSAYDTTTLLVRPLLFSKKLDITSFCATYSIWFFTDITNFDTSISKRNMFRSKLCILDHELLSSSFSKLYTFFSQEEFLWIKDRYLCKHFSIFNEIADYYSFSKEHVQTHAWVKGIFSSLWVYRNITKWLLDEFFCFFSHDSGAKFFSWYWFYICHWIIYVLWAVTSNDKLCLTLSLQFKNTLQKLVLDDKHVSSRSYAKQKAPIFIRWLLPVLLKDWKKRYLNYRVVCEKYFL